MGAPSSRAAKILIIEVWQDLESAHPGAASTRRHYQSHRGTRFPALAMAGDPLPLIAAPKTFRQLQKSISFGPRPSRGQDIVFAYIFFKFSETCLDLDGLETFQPLDSAPRGRSHKIAWWERQCRTIPPRIRET
jgi:hypothetical protein